MKLASRAEEAKVAVVGAGLMGHSIAGVFAAAGSTVTVYDTYPDVLASVPGRVAEQMRNRGLPPGLAERIALHDDLIEATEAADLVIEAVPEKLELKQELLAGLSERLPVAVLATNTSVLRIADVAERTKDPSRVLGTHWFNPPHLVPLVEVIQSEQTDLVYIDWMMQILSQVGKLPVHVRKDVPGFIGNRLQHAMWREAFHLVETGVSDAETVDLVARNSFGLRLVAMGPVENADYVGLDLTLAVHNYVFPDLCNNPAPSRLLIEHVARGELGAKTGSGFLQWGPGARDEATHRLEEHLRRVVAQEG